MDKQPEKITKNLPYQFLRDRGVMTVRDLRKALFEVPDAQQDYPVLIPIDNYWGYVTKVHLVNEDDGFVFPTLDSDVSFDSRDA